MPPLHDALTSIHGICVGSLLLGIGIYMAATGNFNPTILLMSSFMLYSSIRHFKMPPICFEKHHRKRDAIRRRTTVDVKKSGRTQKPDDGSASRPGYHQI